MIQKIEYQFEDANLRDNFAHELELIATEISIGDEFELNQSVNLVLVTEFEDAAGRDDIIAITRENFRGELDAIASCYQKIN